MIPLQWVKHNSADENTWWKLDELNFKEQAKGFSSLYGVYILFHNTAGYNAIEIGLGRIRNIVETKQQDPAYNEYRSWGLYCTFAYLNEAAQIHQAEIVAYLKKEYGLGESKIETKGITATLAFEQRALLM